MGLLMKRIKTPALLRCIIIMHPYSKVIYPPSNGARSEWSQPAMRTENKLKLVGLTMVVVRNLELRPVGFSVTLVAESDTEF